MTTKEKIISVLAGLNDDVSIEQAIERLYLLRKVEIGLEQVNAGDVLDHDEFMKQLENEEAS
jgi:hypothetical protein